MQLSAFTLLKSGSNSLIYRYGDDQSAVILKCVATTCIKQSKHLLNEYKILKKLNHANIVNVLKYKQNVKITNLMKSNEQNNKTINNKDNVTPVIPKDSLLTTEAQMFNMLIMQTALSGNLLDFYKRNYSKLQIQLVRQIFQQIVFGLEYLHVNYVAHRDLKLQNILVFQYQHIGNNLIKKVNVKLADFGFAQYVYDVDNINDDGHDGRCEQLGDNKNVKMFNNFKGTKRGYMAPEIHQCLINSSLSYDALKSDIFALGVILFSLVLGKLPFEFANKDNRLYKFIMQHKYEQFWAEHSKQLTRLQLKQGARVDEFKEMFENMVDYNPEKRWRIEEVKEAGWVKVVDNIKKLIVDNSENQVN